MSLLFDLLLALLNPLFWLDIFVYNSEHKTVIRELNKEPWFQDLMSDFRYSHIILNSIEVEKFLIKEGNFELLKTDDETRKAFIDLVKEQHKKYVSFKK